MELRTQGVVRFAKEIELKKVKISENETKSVINTDIAVNEGVDKVSFFKAEIWGGTADFVAHHFQKGSQAEIRGYLKNKTVIHYKDTDKECKTTETVIVITEVGFVGKKE